MARETGHGFSTKFRQTARQQACAMPGLGIGDHFLKSCFPVPPPAHDQGEFG
jgi:hypothetical protein